MSAPSSPSSASARLARSPAAAWLASHLATPAVVDNRLRSTGSVLSPAAVERYQVLLRAPSHVGAALSMMSRWNLAPLERDLARLTLPVLLVAGERDSWFPPATLTATAALLPHARATVVRATGHLSHEERPEAVAELLLSFGAEVGARAPAD
jgi:magnesium chelatase accessory protein